MELYESQDLRIGEVTKKDIKNLKKVRRKANKPISKEVKSQVKLEVVEKNEIEQIEESAELFNL